jgi:hypothetical protein
MHEAVSLKALRQLSDAFYISFLPLFLFKSTFECRIKSERASEWLRTTRFVHAFPFLLISSVMQKVIFLFRGSQNK